MADINWDLAAKLLSVQTQAAANGAQLSALMGEAMFHLLEMNKSAQDVITERAEKAKKNESVAPPKTLETAAPAPATQAYTPPKTDYTPPKTDPKRDK